jgi:hypothetical protein
MTMEEYTFMEEMGGFQEEAEGGPVQWSTGESGHGGGMGVEAEAAYEDFLRQQS